MNPCQTVPTIDTKDNMYSSERKLSTLFIDVKKFVKLLICKTNHKKNSFFPPYNHMSVFARILVSGIV